MRILSKKLRRDEAGADGEVHTEKKILTIKLEVNGDDVKAFRGYMKDWVTPVQGGVVFKLMRKALNNAVLQERGKWYGERKKT